jgi:hypothetical protein
MVKYFEQFLLPVFFFVPVFRLGCNKKLFFELGCGCCKHTGIYWTKKFIVQYNCTKLWGKTCVNMVESSVKFLVPVLNITRWNLNPDDFVIIYPVSL